MIFLFINYIFSFYRNFYVLCKLNYTNNLSFFICVSFFSLFSCTPQKVNQASTDRLYKKENIELNAKYTIYHLNDSVSQLFYEISNEALLYKKPDSSIYFYSHIKVFLKVSSEDNLSAVIDTASIVIKDRQTEAIVKQLKGDVLFKLKKGFNYYVDVNVIDVHKKTIYTHNLFSNKTTNETRQNFLITNSRNDVLFSSYYKGHNLFLHDDDIYK